jgi:hypothetical protein
LVRDGRAVIKSLIKRENYTLKQSVDAWLWGNRNIEKIKRNYLSSENVYTLRLEDLCNDPEKYKHELFDFCQVQYSSEINYDDITNRHIIGNSMRHSFTGEIRKHDDSWIKELSENDLNYFNSKGGRTLNLKLGYGD